MKSLVFVLLICLLSSCRYSGRICFPVGKSKTPIDFSGKYSAGDVKLSPTSPDSLDDRWEKVREVLASDVIFDFKNKDTVYLDKVFGMKIFGDTVLKYTATKNDIVFTNGEKTFTIPALYEGSICRLSLNSNGIERISILPSNVIKECSIDSQKK